MANQPNLPNAHQDSLKLKSAKINSWVVQTDLRQKTKEQNIQRMHNDSYDSYE